MSFPSTAPVRAHARPWRFPASETRALACGVTLEVLRQDAVPVLHLRLDSLGGRWMASSPGVAGLMASVSRHGTARYDSAALARRQDSLGARLASAAGQDRLQVAAHGLSEHMEVLVELMVEVACRPTFPEADVARERAQLVERRRHSRSDPSRLAGEWLGHALFEGHPYGRVLPGPEALEGLQRDELVAFHAAARGPANSALFAAGDVDPDALAAALDAALAGWDAVPVMPPEPAPPTPLTRRRVILVDRPDSPQAQVSVGFQAMSRSAAGYTAARVMNQVLGGGVSSRLFMDLREKRSLTYGCYSSLDTGRFAGDLSASLSCAGDKLGEALDALFEHFERIRDEPAPAEELQRAQDYLTGAFPNAGASTAGLCGMLAGRWLYGLPADTWATYTEQVEAVDAGQVLAAARALVRPEVAAVVVVGEADALEPVCARWGAVERVSAAEIPG